MQTAKLNNAQKNFFPRIIQLVQRNFTKQKFNYVNMLLIDVFH